MNRAFPESLDDCVPVAAGWKRRRFLTGEWLCGVLAMLTGCSGPATGHGDLKSARTFFDSKFTRSVWTPSLTTPLAKPVELVARDLPAKVDPLDFSFGIAVRDKEAQKEAEGKPRKGKIRVEVLSDPGRQLLGSVVYDEHASPSVHRRGGACAPCGSFILRISEPEPFYPPVTFNLRYKAYLNGASESAMQITDASSPGNHGRRPR
jgi:hypothetical protein